MDHIIDIMEMVNHMPHPAFCVQDGKIVRVNCAASGRMIEVGADIADLLKTGREEYAGFQGDCLYLKLDLSGQEIGASITRKSGFDLFELDSSDTQNGLQALSRASMDLRESLDGAIQELAQLSRTLTDNTQENQARISRINRFHNQLHLLANNMSDADRYTKDTGRHLALCDVCAIVREIVEKISGYAESTGHSIHADILPGPVETLVDAQKLERAVYALISNAMKFTPAGGEIRSSLTRQANMLRFRVTDTGCGIPENQRSRIFSRFLQEPSLNEDRLGLGLSIVGAVAALHEGCVLMDHPKGFGTRVTMTLAIRTKGGNMLRSPIQRVDHTGGRDNCLIELSHILPYNFYAPESDN